MNFLTIGTFDGVHQGHRYLLNQLIIEAQRRGLKSNVLYFDYPAKLVLKNKLSGNILTLPNEKRKTILSTGVDKAVKINFTKALSRMSHKKFFEEILLAKYKMKGLITGRDFAFGSKRNGHIDFLKKQCAKYQIPFIVVSFVKAFGHKISSSLLREMISDGKIETANNLLGSHYTITGKVIKERQLGKKLGFPTANLKVNPHKLLPLGIFAAKAHLGNTIYNSAVNIGFRPTTERKDGNKLSVEAHILDFKGKIYGSEIAIELLCKIRTEKKFKNLTALKTQIKKDIDTVKKLLHL